MKKLLIGLTLLASISSFAGENILAVMKNGCMQISSAQPGGNTSYVYKSHWCFQRGIDAIVAEKTDEEVIKLACQEYASPYGISEHQFLGMNYCLDYAVETIDVNDVAKSCKKLSNSYEKYSCYTRELAR